MVEEKAQIKNENCFKCGHCIAICPANAISTSEYNMNDVKEYNEAGRYTRLEVTNRTSLLQ